MDEPITYFVLTITDTIESATSIHRTRSGAEAFVEQFRITQELLSELSGASWNDPQITIVEAVFFDE